MEEEVVAFVDAPHAGHALHRLHILPDADGHALDAPVPPQRREKERVLADMTPCQEANGVDAARARQLVETTFARRPATADRERGAPS
jgi:hypothetical protein